MGSRGVLVWVLLLPLWEAFGFAGRREGTPRLSWRSLRLCLLRSAEGQQVPAGELLQQRAPRLLDERLHF